MKRIHLLMIAIAVTAGIYACGKDDNNDTTTSTLQVRLTDAPAPWEEVNVDIREVRVKFSDDAIDDDGWVVLPTRAGIYDLLTLQAIDTVLATGDLPVNTVKQVRFILGPDNTIKDNGVVYPLVVPSGSESGLKIHVNKPLVAPVETLVIDFDAGLSIQQEGDGDYKLRPVIKVK